MKICAECRFFQPANSCRHSAAGSRNCVTGQTVAHVERYDKHACGPEGLLWQPFKPRSKWRRFLIKLLS